jgi:hypothetical protein
MLKLTRSGFEEVRTWIHRNAREIELAQWRYHFENGSRDSVLNALAAYQNSDGGFGHGLEADCWNPDSSPYQTLTAISILEGIGFTETAHPIVQGILRFLDSGAHYNENGWIFSIPSNDGYAHAPWWTYSANANTYESIGITAGLTAFILKHTGKDSALYRRAVSETERLLGIIFGTGKLGDMGIGGCCQLLNALKQTGLEQRFDLASLTERLRSLVNNSIVRDTAQWEFYGVRPSNYITNPDSIYFDDNRDIVETELDYLIRTKPAGGGWGITWTWFDNNDKYPKEFAVSENWWKAGKAIEKLLLLRSFGRIEQLEGNQ